jgi:PAS domain S-box-containing protein
MSPHTPDDDRELILEDDDPSAALAQEAPPWRILIVDDDVDVHVVTKFALRDTSFQGRRLSFLHAYNGAEAIALLQSTPGIALVLLDVIMETDDAGLRVARRIREELHNELVRIVLRTGQPGQALEHSIIVDYDINDFWCKADLTTRKLFTTVIASLRAYATLTAAAAAREELKTRLARAHNVQAALGQHALVVTLDADGRIVEANPRFCALAGATPEALAGRTLRSLHAGDLPQAQAIAEALAREGGWAGDIHTSGPSGAPLALRCAVLAFRDAKGAPYQYVAVATLLDPDA